MVTWMATKFNYKYLHRREAGRDLIQKQRNPCGFTERDWYQVAMSQGAQEPPNRAESGMLGTHSLLLPDFSPLELIFVSVIVTGYTCFDGSHLVFNC